MTDPGAATVHVAVENLWDEVVDCTGVLISPRHVITSPYCFFDVDSEFINADPKLTFVSHGSDDSAISLIFKEYPVRAFITLDNIQHSPPPGVEVKGKPSLVKVSHITLFFEEDAMDYHNFLANASKSSLKPMDLTFTEIAILQLQEDIRGNDKLCIQKDFAESIGEHKRRISYFGYDKDVNGTKTHIWRKSGEYQLSKDKCDEYPTKSLKKACENSLMVVKDFATDFDFRNRFRLYGTEGAFFTEERSGRHTAVAMLTHRRNRKEGNKYQATAVAISPAMRVICVYAGVCAEQSVYDKKDTIWAPHVHIDARGMREELSYDIRRYKNIDNNRDEFGFTVLYSK